MLLLSICNPRQDQRAWVWHPGHFFSFANTCCRFSLKRPQQVQDRRAWDSIPRPCIFVSLTYFCRYNIPDRRRALLWIEPISVLDRKRHLIPGSKAMTSMIEGQSSSLDRRLLTPYCLAQSKGPGCSLDQSSPFPPWVETPFFPGSKDPSCTLFFCFYSHRLLFIF